MEMEQTLNEKLLAFLAESPTAFHACRNLALRLEGEGYLELLEQDEWQLQPGGKYFVRRNASALIAFRIPTGGVCGFLMMAAHSDSPSFKIKEHGAVPTAGMYTRLNVEKYGGMLCASWMDRPLSVAGRAAVREEGRIVMKLVNVQRDLLLIPHVAIHMDRSANDGKAYNVNVDMLPLFGSADIKTGLNELVAAELGIAPADIISRELNLYTRTPGVQWGAENEFISAPRLDDLQCAYACLQGFLQAETPANIAVYCSLDNEEVGSTTRQGADSTFLDDVLFRVWASLGHDMASYRAALARSFMVSADNAHAIHPNHPEFADRSERPVMNGGIVIKFNASMSYTTDGLSAAVFSELCRAAEVPVQRYSNRPDLRGGGTLGHISLAHVSVPTLDIGLAQLAMHSSYETAGAKDTDYLVRAARAFYESGYRVSGESISL
jgi:aspartyl aminopeptidase